MNVREFYNRTADIYDKRHKNPWTLWMRKSEIRMIKRFANGKILDIGCGTGFHLDLIKNKFQYWGIDASEEMLKIAKGKGLKNLKHARAEKLPFKREFDTIFCFFSVLNRCNLLNTVKEIYRVLKPRGRVLISISSIWEAGGKRKLNFTVDGVKTSINLYTKREIINVFERNGFRLEFFDSIFSFVKPRWGDFEPFTFSEKIKNFLERILQRKEKGKIYFMVFKKI